MLVHAVVVPVQSLAEGGAEMSDFAFLGSTDIPAERVILAGVDAIAESQLGAEMGREVVVVGGKTEMAVVVRCVSPQRIALLRPGSPRGIGKGQTIESGGGVLPRPAVHSLYVDDPIPGEFQPSVQPSHALNWVREITP